MRRVWPSTPVLGLAAFFFLLAIGGGPVRAHTFNVSLKATGDESMADELKELIEDKEDKREPAVDGAAALQRARTQLRRLTLALRSRGYYGASIAATINGRPIEDPATLDALEALPRTRSCRRRLSSRPDRYSEWKRSISGGAGH